MTHASTARPVVLVAIGTRPELIKMAPVVRALEALDVFTVRVLFTGQHRELLDQMAEVFALEAHADLSVMTPGQTLPALTARLILALDEVLEREQPTVVLGQGDTTTVLTTSLACLYRKIPFGHVEAGLRTPDLFSPFPEEANRRLTSVLARHHFAPTAQSADNLRREGIPAADIHMTGNTVVDALQLIASGDLPLPVNVPESSELVLVTLHRRESFGRPLVGVLQTFRRLLEDRPQLTMVWPVHPNPNVLGPAHEALGDLPNAHLIAPVDYREFVGLMRRATLILTDSGGVQEEAPSLHVPILVLRETTERPEGVEAGVSRLVGTDPETIYRQATRLLDDPAARAEMGTATNPYGDGKAAQRIAAVLGAAYAEG